MDPQESAVSASAGFKSRSASPHPPHLSQNQYPDPTGGLTAFDPAATNATSFDPNTTSTLHNPSLSSTGTESYGYPNTFLPADGISQTLAPNDQDFGPAQQFSQSFQASFVNQLEQSGLQRFQPEDSFPNMINANPVDFGFSIFPSQTANPTEFDPASLVLDTQLLQQQQQQSPSPSHSLAPASGSSLSPADLASRMSSPPHTSPPAQLSPHDAQVQVQAQAQQHSSPGGTMQPDVDTGVYYTPSHSRHASLDPATAAYMTNPSHPDWKAMVGNAAFQQHRRTPSEVSDVSSATHSPFTAQHESFDLGENNPSPLMAAQIDPTLYDNAFGIESFTLSEHQHHHQRQGFSPAHSPYVSPRLMPQQGGVDMGGNVPFLSTQGGDPQYPLTSPDIFGDGQEAIMGMASGSLGPSDMGQASQMAPPSINVEFAPPSRNSSFGPGKPPGDDFDSLSPPILRARGRSKSDPFAHSVSRSRSPISTSSSLEPMASTSPRSLSPPSSTAGYRSTPSSRDTSPARGHNRRLSTSSIDNRYILDLADPARPGGLPGDSKRVQKHPATFQCHLCPKRFTRAYNLRSHLRTHTDERPFVCTVCGKAFARQHDRKRHEGLHSGEKKFVCRGDLSQGGQWGCGRRFARADALGRHFRSEAGRICIKPLLDEESEERNRARLLQQQHQQQQQQQDQQQQQQQQAGLLQPTMPQPLMVSGMDGQPTNTFVLPAALLAQYPALQTLQWDQIAAAADDPNDLGGGGRSSFDASSGNEYGFDDDESGISSGGGGDHHSNIFVNDQEQMVGSNPDSSEWRG